MTARAPANGHRAEPPHRPVDWSAPGYRPAEGTPARTCIRCGARYLDDEPCRTAHITVFGHSAKPAEPAKRAADPQPDPQEEP